MLLVEDRPSLHEVVAARLGRVGGISTTWASHFRFANATLDRRHRRMTLDAVARHDLILLDVFDRDQTQDQPSRSAFRCLDIIDVVAEAPHDERPTVVAYSTAMTNPAVHLAVHTTGLVSACYLPADLVDDLDAIVRGRYPRALPTPEAETWTRVHPALRVGADLARLHREMERHPRIWRIVCDPGAPFDQAAQKWIKRNILPWLADTDHPTYRIAIDVTRAIAGFTESKVSR